MKIAITGGSGFVGQNLIPYLQKNKQTIVRKILRSELQQTKIVLPAEVNAVIHLAGKAHDLKKTSAPEEYDEVNFEITKRLYSAFLQSDASKFVYISSVKAVADSVDHILDESEMPDPQTAYGKSKLKAEQYIINTPLPQGKYYYILRPCMIHGPGNKGNLNLLYKIVKKNIPYPLAGFTNKRSFLTVGNLCFVINEIAKRNDIEGGVYNIADNEPLSTNDVINILSQSLSKNPALWHISPSFIKLVAKIGDVVHLPLNTERLGKLIENFVVDNSKIKKAIGKPLPFTASQGMLLTAKSFNH